MLAAVERLLSSQEKHVVHGAIDILDAFAMLLATLDDVIKDLQAEIGSGGLS